MSDELIEAVAKSLRARFHESDSADETWRQDARAAIYAIEAAGFAIVPREPTDEMLSKGGGFNEIQRFHSGRIYTAMLSARPKVTT